MCGPSRDTEAAQINPERPWRAGLETSAFPSSARPAALPLLPWGNSKAPHVPSSMTRLSSVTKGKRGGHVWRQCLWHRGPSQ